MFLLVRDVDVTGVSGTGVVAEGIQFTNGKCALSWWSDIQSIGIYNGIQDIIAIHGHGGSTRIEWIK
jgi:hypothetical protein